MSVAAQLGLDDPAGGLLARARTDWPAWCGRDPRLAVVDALLALPGWIRSADRDDVDDVLHRLARLGSPTGGDDIALRLRTGGRPSTVSDWVVTDPLIVETATYAHSPDVPAAAVGGVRITYPSYSFRPVWGYPGGYELAAAPPTTHRAQVDPLWIAVGAVDGPRWNQGLRQLHRRGSD